MVCWDRPDFVAISHDTVLNRVSVCRTLNDSTTLAQFYGTDSVTYIFMISVPLPALPVREVTTTVPSVLRLL